MRLGTDASGELPPLTAAATAAPGPDPGGALSRALVMTALVVAGETIFILPFVVARIFRPTLLDVFGLTNFQLGTAFSLYGIVAMISYFFGGPIADRFSARRLMTTALVATALGGFFLANIPSLPVLRVLFAYWGATTILLFWAALIRAGREWGGVSSQGRAYGILDGGRGLLAAVVSSVSVMIFATLLPTDVASATLAQRSEALSTIIWIFTGLTVTVAALVWVVVPDGAPREGEAGSQRLSWEGVRKVFGMKAVWLQATIIICAYVAYKATDDFSLLARDAFGYDDVESARIGTISFWVRPFAAVGAGLLGDRITNSKATVWSFAILGVGASCIAAGFMQPGMHWIIAGTVAGTSVGIYALRGLYFALLQEARVPLAFTGSAVGLLSVVGYTPDVFMGPVMGWLLDRSPGALGHQHVFALVAVSAVAGLIATLLFQRVARRAA